MTSSQTVVASFASPDRAKAAVADLERRGVAATDLQVLDQAAPGRDLAAADERAVGWLAGVAGRGATVGALVGGLALLVVIAVAKEGDPDVTWVLASIGGALGGALVGAMVNVGRRSPRNPQAWGVHGRGPDQVTRLAVRAQGVSTTELVALLEGAGATSVGLEGSPGHP
jgi:hypothetical protein